MPHQLGVLDLSSCQVDDDMISVIAETLVAHPILRQIDFQDNPITDAGANSIMQAQVEQIGRYGNDDNRPFHNAALLEKLKLQARVLPSGERKEGVVSTE